MAGTVITDELRKTTVIPCVKAICSAAAFLEALRRGTRSKPEPMDVIFFHVGRAPIGGLGERSPADYRYWTDQG